MDVPLGIQKIGGLGDSLQVQCTYIERDSGGHFHLTRFSALYVVPAAVLTSGGPAAAGGGDGGGDDGSCGSVA